MKKLDMSFDGLAICQFLAQIYGRRDSDRQMLEIKTADRTAIVIANQTGMLSDEKTH